MASVIAAGPAPSSPVPPTVTGAGAGGPSEPPAVRDLPQSSGLYGRMIRRDFARNRSVTVLLVVLMMLSVVLATASAGTLVRLVGASDALLTQADAPHVAQLHAGAYDQSEVDSWAADRPEVAHTQSMLLLGIDGAELFFDGVAQTTNIQQNSLVVPNAERDLLLDLDNQPITDVSPGTIILPVIYQVETGLETGDVVRITAADGFDIELTVAGFARDSIMNPAVTSSKRLAVSPSDLAKVREHTGSEEHLISFWLDDPGTQSAAFQKAYQDAGLPQAGQMVDSAAFRMFTMVSDGMVAAVVILVSVLLLVVALLCLRFSFLTAAEQDYREIGVLKGIGVAPRDVKKIYLTKYAVLAAVASGLGLLGGFALIPLLTRSMSRYMGSTASVSNWVVPVAAAVLVFALLVLFILVLLRRLDKVSAVTALSAGATGRQARAARLRLHRSRMPVHLRLGTMDVTGRWTTYLLLFFVFAVSTFILIVPVNSATTANAPGFITYMGIGSVDLRLDLRHEDDTSGGQFARTVEQVRADPDAATVVPMVTTRNDSVDQDGNAISLYVENGDHTVLPPTYADGRAPQDETEIALSLLALNQAGLQVGDTLAVEVGGQDRDLAVVGSYQDITNGGKTAKSSLPTDGNEVLWYVVGVQLAPGTDVGAKAQDYTEQLAPAKVADIEQWRAQTLGPIANQLTITAGAAAIVGVTLAMLMTALFTRMLLARDAGPIAIQRALGADDAGLRRQYLTRVVIVLVLGVVVGALAANTLGQGLFNLMFEGMFGGFESLGQGTSRIDFVVSPLLTYVLLPGVLLVGVAAATIASTRSISTTSISALTTE